MKEQILLLRSQGLTYNEIQDILGCSKGTISYHCGDGQKEKSLNRLKSNKSKIRSKIYSKIDTFISRVKNSEIAFGKNYVSRDNRHNEMYKKIINYPYCYLTGEKINLEDSKSYQLDHIIPYSISKDNTIDNMGLASKRANQSKADMSFEEYIYQCKKVLEHNGYKVTMRGGEEVNSLGS